MKLLLLLSAVVASITAVPLDGWSGGWQNPWQNPWQDPWQAQPHYVKQIVPVHKVIPVHHAPVHHVQAHHIPQQPPIPPLHPQPLKLKVHSHPVKIPYHYPKIPHPHLIGYEVAVHEPEVKHVVKPVHHHHF